MCLLPPHSWPIIYLWTMGLSCRPAHKLLWQRLKGKHLLGRLLPPWGCKKDRGNVSRDKDRGDLHTPKSFKWSERSSLSVLAGCVCWLTLEASLHAELDTVCKLSCPIEALKEEFKFFFSGRDLSLSCTWCITLLAQCHTLGQKGAGVREGVTLRTL